LFIKGNRNWEKKRNQVVIGGGVILQRKIWMILFYLNCLGYILDIQVRNTEGTWSMKLEFGIYAKFWKCGVITSNNWDERNQTEIMNKRVVSKFTLKSFQHSLLLVSHFMNFCFVDDWDWQLLYILTKILQKKNQYLYRWIDIQTGR
jgi:hypothetical protein